MPTRLARVVVVVLQLDHRPRAVEVHGTVVRLHVTLHITRAPSRHRVQTVVAIHDLHNLVRRRAHYVSATPPFTTRVVVADAQVLQRLHQTTLHVAGIGGLDG